jgi:hypothetical protein
MEQDPIIKKIEEIYLNKNKDGKPVGKNFITHLIRAYFPLDKVQKVIDVPKNPMKCAITGKKLFAAGEILMAMHDDPNFFKDMTKHMVYQLDPEKNEKAEHPFTKVVGGRVLGFTGEKTDTYLCHEAIQGLFNWYAEKILHGDKYISWLGHDIRRQTTFAVVREKLPAAEDQKKIDKLEKISKHPKRATMSLGDLSALQEIHQKLKAQEEEKKD